jgi:DNA-binding phage protein
MKVKVLKYDPYEGLETEEKIQSYVELVVEETQKDNDLKSLAHCLGIAAEARRRLKAKNGTSADVAESERLSEKDYDPISTFGKIVRSFGYQLTLAPV